MASNSLALSTLKAAIIAAVNTIPSPKPRAPVFIGWPTPAQLKAILDLPGNEAQITIWPPPGARNVTRSASFMYPVEAREPGTTGTISGHALTLAGTPTKGDIVHAIFGKPALDAAYAVNAGDTVTVIAAALATQISGFNGYGATAVAGVITLTGGTFSYINIGATLRTAREVSRIARNVQVSVWTSSDENRDPIVDAIIENVGTEVQPFLRAPDGTGVRCAYATDRPSDTGSALGSVFRWDIIFELEYGISQYIKATPVEAVETIIAVDGAAPVTSVFGGPE